MIFLVILHVFVSLVLIFVILLQAGKGGGLSESFGGASQQLFGTKSSAFLNRATSVCAILFLATCLSLGIFSSHGRRSLMEATPPKVSKGDVTQKETPPPPAKGPDEKLPKPTVPPKEEGAK